ncbi:MAG TPA: FAD-binding protein, partial [Myxococcota bacterium]|nr:FAD-binding protein [Myxococcota bacterium]
MSDERWTNFSGRVTCAPARFARPRDEAELVAAVTAATADGRGLRVAGTGHSFTPLCATGGTLVSLDDWQGIASLDRER